MSRTISPRLVRASCSLSAFLAVAPALAADPGAPATPADRSAGSAVFLEPVTVTASPLTQDADGIATVVGVVGREEILRQGGANLADSLANVPGVTGSGFATGASRPVIRGLDANRVRVLENGLSSSDVSDIGPDHGVPIDPLSSQRIEVIRGPATLRYGSQAIGGVVNATDNRVPTYLPTETVTGTATGSYDSNGHIGAGAGEVDGHVGRLALHADGFGRRASDYNTPSGPQVNSFFNGDGYSGGGSYFFGPGNASHVGLAATHYDAKYGIPSDTTFISMRQTKVLARSEFAIDAGPLQKATLDAGYADYRHDEVDPDSQDVLSTFKNHEVDVRGESLFGVMGMFSASALGFEVQNRDFSALGEDSSYLFPTITRSHAVFAFTEVPITERLKVQGGGRVERVEVNGTPASDIPTDRSFSPASGSLGLVYDPVKVLRLGLSLSSTARAPAQTELYARGAHDGPQTFETGDPNLGQERANSIEGTARFRYNRVRIEGAVYVTRFSDYIFGRLTGRTCDEDGDCTAGGDYKELNYAQANATFRGAELKGVYGLYQGVAGHFDAIVLGDYVRATLDDGNGNVPRIPPYHLGGGLDWKLGAFDAGVLLKHAGAQRQLAENDPETNAFNNLDAHIGWRPHFSDRYDFELAVVGHNLTNTDQRNAVALNKDVVELPGRNVRVVLRAGF